MKNLVVLCVAFTVSLIALELAARALTSQQLSQSWMMVDDRGLTLNRPNTRATHHRGDASTTYHINAFHMRGDMPVADVPSILVLGDSFTFGWLVDRGDTLTQHLQDQADAMLGKGRVQFLNAGTGGWGTASYIDFFTRYSPSIEVAGVLIFANATDFNRASQRSFYEIDNDHSVHRVMKELSTATLIKKMITENTVYRWLAERSYLLYMAKQAVLVYGAAVEESAPAGAEMLISEKFGAPALDVQKYNAALLRHFKTLLDERSIPVFVSSQYHWQYTADVYEWLAPVMNELEIPFLPTQRDLAMATGGDVAGYFINGDPHPNGKTYKILAAKTWNWLSPQLKEQSIGR